MLNENYSHQLGVLNRILGMLEKKCLELPVDIDYWESVASQHKKGSTTYQNVILSSVNPRKDYLVSLQNLSNQLVDIIAMVKGTFLVLKSSDINVDMSIGTILRKFVEFLNEYQKNVDNKSFFIKNYKKTLEGIKYIQNTLNQTVLSCSIGEFNFKDFKHQILVLESVLQKNIHERMSDQKVHVDNISDIVFQKIEMDIAIIKNIQDRVAMHLSLQRYMEQIESDLNFSKLLPSIQQKIREMVACPIDKVMVEQQYEVDKAKHELQQLLEPIHAYKSTELPNSAISVHQLIQQAVNQQRELARIKVNVAGVFKHMVNQLQQLFNYQPISPVQSASIIGAAWLNNPLTTVDDIELFKEDLSKVKKTEAYVSLTKYFDEKMVDESFEFISKKMSNVIDNLDINKMLSSEMNMQPDLIFANDVCINKNEELFRSRRFLLNRAKAIESIKKYVDQLLKYVRSQAMLVFYEHSLDFENVDINFQINNIKQRAMKQFVQQKSQALNLDPSVLSSIINNGFDDMCYMEFEKNNKIISTVNEIKCLRRKISIAKQSMKRSLRQQFVTSKKTLRKMMIDINVPRLKFYLKTTSAKKNRGIGQEKYVSIKQKLSVLLQEKIILEQFDANDKVALSFS